MKPILIINISKIETIACNYITFYGPNDEKRECLITTLRSPLKKCGALFSWVPAALCYWKYIHSKGTYCIIIVNLYNAHVTTTEKAARTQLYNKLLLSDFLS